MLTRDLPSIILSKCPLIAFFSVSYKEPFQKQLVKLFLFVNYNIPPSVLIYNTDDTKIWAASASDYRCCPLSIESSASPKKVQIGLGAVRNQNCEK